MCGAVKVGLRLVKLKKWMVKVGFGRLGKWGLLGRRVVVVVMTRSSGWGVLRRQMSDMRERRKVLKG